MSHWFLLKSLKNWGGDPEINPHWFECVSVSLCLGIFRGSWDECPFWMGCWPIWASGALCLARSVGCWCPFGFLWFNTVRIADDSFGTAGFHDFLLPVPRCLKRSKGSQLVMQHRQSQFIIPHARTASTYGLTMTLMAIPASWSARAWVPYGYTCMETSMYSKTCPLKTCCEWVDWTGEAVVFYTHSRSDKCV